MAEGGLNIASWLLTASGTSAVGRLCFKGYLKSAYILLMQSKTTKENHLTQNTLLPMRCQTLPTLLYLDSGLPTMIRIFST